MPIKILIVEDDAPHRAALVDMLTHTGHFVETAADGLEALRKVRVGLFDVVLMNYRLPEIDGVAAAKLIADLTHESQRPRLIGLRAKAQGHAREDSVRHVFDAIIDSQASQHVLVETIRRVHQHAPQGKYRWDEDEDVFSSGVGRFGHLIRRAIPRPDAGQGQVIDEPSSGKIRVLVVDDDDMLRAVVQAALQKEGFEVEAAGNGLEGFQAIARSHYHVVVLDVQMPEIDGLATARLVFELLSRADRPRLIALTSVPEHLREREAGTVSVFDEVIPKSLAISYVVSAVRQSAEYKRRRPPVDPINLVNLANLAKLLTLDPLNDPMPQPENAPADHAQLPILDVAALDLVASYLSRAAVASNLRVLSGKAINLLHAIDGTENLPDEEKLVQEAHALAGSAGLLGFKRLSDMCVRYEQASLKRSADKSVALISLRTTLELSITEIKNRLLQLADA